MFYISFITDCESYKIGNRGAQFLLQCGELYVLKRHVAHGEAMCFLYVKTCFSKFDFKLRNLVRFGVYCDKFCNKNNSKNIVFCTNVYDIFFYIILLLSYTKGIKLYT